ncbi:MAG TPA: POTRA domain-containing protein [Bryobacteraceae bacterium]|nr:POTRA domain-containing protein [Bryobacteraceae bacterium]
MIALLAVCAAAVATDAPQPESFEGRKVLSVRFEPPEQPLPRDYLERIVSLKSGSEFHMAAVREAIKRLHATGRFAEITAEGEPVEGGLNVVFRTTDQWFVGQVDAGGKIKDPPNRGQLANATGLELGTPFLRDELNGGTERILALLHNNGFYEARVEPKVTRDPAHQQVHVVYIIEAGKRARLTTPVIMGNPVLSPETITKATKWNRPLFFPWRQATEDNVQRGIKNVRNRYRKDRRLTAQVTLGGMKYDPRTRRVTPTLHVNGGPKVEIKTSGAKISRGKLEAYVPVFDEGTVDRDLLTEGAKRLRDYYQGQGYFDVEVDFEQKQLAPDHQTVVYAVNRGERQKVVGVQVLGNHYFKTDAIRERMYIQPAGLVRLRHGRYSTGFARRDEDAIKALYQGNGFRDVKARTQTIDDYKGKHNQMLVVMHIDEGPQYLVSDFTMDGVKQIDKGELVSMLSSVPGEPFSELNVAMDRNFILRQYNSQGFADAAFTWSMKAGAQPNRVDVHYAVTEGERRYVRDVVISGLNETRMRLIRPAMRLRPDDPLSLTAMTDTQRNLYDLGIFDQVDTAVQNPEGDTDHKYVLYEIQEGHRYALAGGFGAELARIGGSQNSWDSPGGKTGFSPRVSLDFSRLNLWGLGHSLNFKGQLSSLQQTASLNYLAPRYRNVDGRNLSFTALYDNRRDVRTFTSLRRQVSAQYSQKLSKANTLLARYTIRRSSVSDLKIDPLLVPLLSQPARIGMVEGSFIGDRRDDPADARRGMYNTADFGVATKFLASNRSFVRFLGSNATYKTFRSHYTLAQRTQFGWIGPFAVEHGVNAVESIPLPERFFGGGSTSHRGFPDNQAGPRDPYSGFPLGGNALLIHNTELRFPFLGENIDGVLFHDMGNVFSSPSNISFRVHQKDVRDFDYMVHAVGFGIRYRTPVGPVRIDLSYSMNPPRFFGFKGTTEQVLAGTAPRVEQGVSHFQFFFSIGQAF